LFGSKRVTSTKKKKIQTALNGKAMLFFDSNGIILPNWVPLKQGVNGECYAKTALWNAVCGKRGGERPVLLKRH
jgi:hypothetical protein